MRREPALTFEGALTILGAEEPKLLKRLSSVLGGVVLASGVAGAAAAGVGPAGAAAAATMASVWGWVDQKNEAMNLLGTLRETFLAKISQKAPRERRQVVASAHTTIVMAALFQAVREALGKDLYSRLDLSSKEMYGLIPGRTREAQDDLARKLYESEIPAPSAALGFHENRAVVRDCIQTIALQMERFLQGLAAWPGDGDLSRTVVDRAEQLYEEHYVNLAAVVPEFAVWASLAEHAATRSKISASSVSLQHALAQQHANLLRIEAILALTSAPNGGKSAPQEVIARANRSRLDSPVVHREDAEDSDAVQFPAIGDAFVAPLFRTTRVERGTRVADESWWEAISVHSDLDVWFAAYATSPDSTRIPLLLLGHPGAGKSTLMKVLAARLPSTDYTVVLVPLRTVGANAPIVEQVQQALDQVTNRRVDWPELADSSSNTIRVVILDGLDELLQASGADRSGFLQEAMTFQQIEAEQNRPVIVIVTSRTIVADRVEIPSRSVVLKLEEFDESRIKRWIAIWNEANAGPVTSGLARSFSLDAALTQRELARQPLLLLMLALHHADPAFPPLDQVVSAADLYERIIERFARREVLKGRAHTSRERTKARVESQIDRLSVAALSMFNRGAQYISDRELSRDLTVLLDTPVGEGDDLGQRLFAEFFFVHSSEATLIQGPAQDADALDEKRSRRAYEFLHATFGEYLVARRLLEELRDLADVAYAGRRSREPEDDLFFALARYEPIAVRSSILGFLTERFAALSETERVHIVDALAYLCRTYRRRRVLGKYGSYNPVSADSLRQLAAYSANLVLLRVAFAAPEEPVRVQELVGEDGDPSDAWRAMVTLWQAGLDAAGWQAMLGALEFNNGVVTRAATEAVPEPISFYADWVHARLAGAQETQSRLTYGLAVRERLPIPERMSWTPESWTDAALASVYATLSGGAGSRNVLEMPVPPGLNEAQIAQVASGIERLLLLRQANGMFAGLLFQRLIELGRAESLDPVIVVVNVCRFPDLLVRVPELNVVPLDESPRALLALACSLPPARKAPNTVQSERDDTIPTDESGALSADAGPDPEEVERLWAAFIARLLNEAGSDRAELEAEYPASVRDIIEFVALRLRDDRWERSSLDRSGRNALRDSGARRKRRPIL